MTLIARLDDWRETLRRGHAEDGEEPPTEEEVLAQFLYSAVDAGFKADGMVEALLCSGPTLEEQYFDHALNVWLDAYAGAFTADVQGSPE